MSRKDRKFQHKKVQKGKWGVVGKIEGQGQHAKEEGAAGKVGLNKGEKKEKQETDLNKLVTKMYF